MGGDGTFSHCLNALLRRVSRDDDHDVNDKSLPPRKAPLPLGVIPAGKLTYLNAYFNVPLRRALSLYHHS